MHKLAGMKHGGSLPVVHDGALPLQSLRVVVAVEGNPDLPEGCGLPKKLDMPGMEQVEGAPDVDAG